MKYALLPPHSVMFTRKKYGEKEFLAEVFLAIILTSWLGFLAPCISAQCLTQLTVNSYCDRYPKIHSGQVTWFGYHPLGGDGEIFFWDGITTYQITDNLNDEFDPLVDNGKIVWLRWDGSDGEVFFYDGKTTTQITNNSFDDQNPQIHGGQLVWQGFDGNDDEIFFWDGASTTQLTNNSYDDEYPQINNGQVVWEARMETNWEIMFWDGTTTANISNTPDFQEDLMPQIHNGQVAWHGWDGEDYEIFLWDGNTITQVTNNSLYADYEVKLHNGQIVWQGSDGTDYEIFFWDGTVTTPIANDELFEGRPQLHNGQVVWEHWDGNDTEIFFWDGMTTTNITNNISGEFDPDIYGGQVVWEGDCEIFFWNSTPDILKNLRFTSLIDLMWSANACPGATYDAIRGNISQLSEVGGSIDLGAVTCIEDDSPDVMSTDAAAPPFGETWFYLVRTSSGNYGISSDGKLRTPSSGDCP